MIVAKFGGSSLADADQFKKVRAIVEQDPDRRVIVVSAAGKGANNPIKLTDQLIRIYQLAKDGIDYSELLNAVWDRLELIVNELRLSIPIHEELAAISRNLNQLNYAELVSRGEYLTAKLFANYLGWPMVDAADFLVLNNGQVDYQASGDRLHRIGQSLDRCVIPGFYGVNDAGTIQLLPRGGGDTTGAIVANLLDAKCYENWTDTNGILAVDPRIVAQPTKVDVLSYDELQELSYLGVQVFNEEAVEPVRAKQIPINIRNTNAPNATGSLVVARQSSDDHQSMIAGVSGKRNQVVITIKKYHLASNAQLLIDVIKLLDSINLKSSYAISGDVINLVVAGLSQESAVDSLVHTIKQVVAPDALAVKTGVAKLAVVAEAFREQQNVVGQLVDTLLDQQIVVQQVVQNSGDIKVAFIVDNHDYQRAIQCLYAHFFNQSHLKQRASVSF